MTNNTPDMKPPEFAAAMEEECQPKTFASFCNMVKEATISTAHLCGFRAGVLRTMMYMRTGLPRVSLN